MFPVTDLSERSDVVSVLWKVTVVVETEEKLGKLRSGLTTSDGGEEGEEEAGLASEVDRQRRKHFGLLVGQVGLGHSAKQQTGCQKFGETSMDLK